MVPKKFQLGFTLIELMVVVFIIAILAATALPLVGKYLRKSKTSEATINLRKIYDGEVAYFIEEHTNSVGVLLTKRFITCSATPSTTTARKQTGNWENCWPNLKFAPDSPVMFRYQTIASTTIGLESKFTARAEGDLDGDLKTSLFERVAAVNSTSGEVEGGAAVFVLDSIE